MSLQYNNTSSPYNGIIQQIEKEIGANRGDIYAADTGYGGNIERYHDADYRTFDACGGVTTSGD